MPGLLVVCSGLIAIHTVVSLVGTQIKGIAGTSQDEQTKSAQWNGATMWSLPKLETLRLFIPGVFGYRLDVYIHDSDRSSAYWGRVGEDPRVSLIPLVDSSDPEERRSVARAFGLPKEYEDILASNDPQIRNRIAEPFKAQLREASFQKRHSGTGAYAGILVGLLAFFGIANAFRGTKTPYDKPERRAVWFWTVVALVALGLAFGRFSFPYRLFYQLPYASTIRNPVKFLFPFHVMWIILAGYGLEALRRRYLLETSTRTEGLLSHVKRWWAKAAGFEKKWAVLSFMTIGVAVFATLVLLSSRGDLERHIADAGFSAESATKMASFFFGELFWFIVYLTISAGVIICILSGAWAGRRAKWAWIFMGVILVCDLSRSDWRWIRTLISTSVTPQIRCLTICATKPARAGLPEIWKSPNMNGSSGIAADRSLYSAYFFILQNQIPYLNIQSLDFIQMPRMPQLDATYMDAFRHKAGDFSPCFRMWQLTNTRYILAGTAGRNVANLNFDALPGFQPRLSFNVAPYPWLSEVSGLPEDMTYVQTNNGSFTLYGYTNALPGPNFIPTGKPAAPTKRKISASWPPPLLILPKR